MIDTTLKELWETKDQIAKEHDYDLDRLVEFLRRKSSATYPPVISPTTRERQAGAGRSGDRPLATA